MAYICQLPNGDTLTSLLGLTYKEIWEPAVYLTYAGLKTLRACPEALELWACEFGMGKYSYSLVDAKLLSRFSHLNPAYWLSPPYLLFPNNDDNRWYGPIVGWGWDDCVPAYARRAMLCCNPRVQAAYLRARIIRNGKET